MAVLSTAANLSPAATPVFRTAAPVHGDFPVSESAIRPTRQRHAPTLSRVWDGLGVMRDEIERAWQKAADCAARAQDADDPNIRELFIRLRDSWIGAANRAEFIAGMDPYLDAVEHGSAQISAS